MPPLVMPRAVWAVLVLALVSARPAAAWGPTGHRAAGRIAERHLTPQAARTVEGWLAPEQLAYVGTWADEIRSEPQWSKADAWHYLNIPDGQSYGRMPKSEAGDVVEAIGRFRRALADPASPRLERVQALKWLTHLVADVHQPMHVGLREDRGGNDVLVLWFSEPSNLHAVWDQGIVDRSQLSFSELALLIDHATPDEVRLWQASPPEEWARESQELRRACYELGDHRLSYRYLHDHWPTVQRRLLQAGVRLAGELNRLLATP